MEWLTPESSSEAINSFIERAVAHARTLPGADPQAVAVLLCLYQTANAFAARASQRIGGHGISYAGFHLLMALRHCHPGGCPLHALGEVLLVTRGNITGVVDSLEARGLVTREPYPNDRRVRLARITPAGVTLLDEILPRQAPLLAQAMSSLSASEKQTLLALLGRLRAGLEAV